MSDCDCKTCDIHANEHSNAFSSGVIVGALVGGIAAYIYSAPNGKENAQKILDKGGEILANLDETTREHATKLADQVQQAHEEGKFDPAIEATQKAASQAQETAQAATTSASEGLKKFFTKNGKKTK